MEALMAIDYRDYVKEDRVHSRIFTDPAVFEDELRNIFYCNWVYLGHEDEVAHAGDYKLKWIGRQSVIMSRDEDGAVHALMNRCRHRGNAVCSTEQGNASFFRCQYHGWTYRNSGELVGVTFPDGYPGDFDKSRLGLSPVPRLASYRGLVFASLAPEGPTLEEYLGHALEIIDLAVQGSPTGKLRLGAGVHKTVFRGNWKYVGMDGYHVNFTHASIKRLNKRKEVHEREVVGADNAFSDSSANRTVDMGNGHVRLDTTLNASISYEDAIAPSLQSPGGREWIESLEAAYGPDRVRDIVVITSDPHLGVFPNLQMINSQIRVIRPLAPDLTEVYIYPTTLDGVPDEINETRLRNHEWFYGPSGFGQPDDGEMVERNQLGLQAEVDPWILLSRGLHRQKQLPDGTIVGHISDEVTQRGQMRAWLAAMVAGSAPAIAG
jgi:phenylpropionate dioxygenase-like ring-hydroxylating dioxygenase large terminal subunit